MDPNPKPTANCDNVQVTSVERWAKETWLRGAKADMRLDLLSRCKEEKKVLREAVRLGSVVGERSRYIMGDVTGR